MYSRSRHKDYRLKFTGNIPGYSGTKIITPQFNTGHWLFPEQMGGKEYTGFIYIIRDIYMKRFYLGKKSFIATQKGKKMESNWRKYVSSSNLLKAMLCERPLSDFDFIVLEQYRTKGILTYAETWSLCLVEAPTTVNWYNTRIEAISWPVKEAITNRHKERLRAAINFESFEKEK